MNKHFGPGGHDAEPVELRKPTDEKAAFLANREPESKQPAAAVHKRVRGSARSGRASFQQAKSPSPKRSIFTNCGKAERREKPAKRAKNKLNRVPFTVSRLMEFCTERELVNVTGHGAPDWPLVVIKETLDNATDAAEEAEIAPIISVDVNGTTITVEDNAGGIPAKTIKHILDYSKRTSSREAYVSPSRGAQGNALSSILPMSYVLNAHHGEQASGRTIIEAHGIAHHIKFGVDHIMQEPKITHTTERSTVIRGTRIMVDLPVFENKYSERDLVAENEVELLELAEAYTWLNPHLTLRVTWNGEVKIDAKASNPNWKRWSPSWPTSAHWYDEGRLRRYMAAHISNRRNVTVREFISEFRGMSSTAKQKQVLAETGASHRSLHDFFGLHKVSTANIAKLLASLRKHTKPVRPTDLGIIGKAHLYTRMEAAGGDPKTFKYERRLGETNGIPRIVEFAFGIHRAGLDNMTTRGPSRKEVTGVNSSPGIHNPFRHIGHSGEGLDALLMNVRANVTEPVIVVLHVACPRVTYTDRGKTAIVIEGEVDNNAEED
jgi:DNA topoisomerase VI subunit B